MAKGDDGKTDGKNPEDCQDGVEGHLLSWENKMSAPFLYTRTRMIKSTYRSLEAFQESPSHGSPQFWF